MSSLPEAVSTDDDRFFSRLAPLPDFRAIANPQGFVPVPGGWSVAVTDVVNSTDAIARGRYKDVNAVGAMGIVALLNAAPPDVELPFVFGGDGATVLIPDNLRGQAEGALLATRRIARDEFGLDLRVGIVPIDALYRAGARLRIARLDVSPHYAQALFAGGGLTLAERWIKDSDHAQYQVVMTASDYAPDYSGYTCRWATIPSPHAENVTLMVQGTGDEARQNSLYRDVLDEIERVYGDARQRHPVATQRLRPATSDTDLLTEAKVFSTPANRKRYLMLLRGQIAVTNLWIALKTRTPGPRLSQWFPRAAADAPVMEWGRYKDYIREASDCQKVDGTLRMIISGYPAQREKLTAFLQTRHATGSLVYGLHVAGGSLMTCLVFQPNGRQVHFVDGAGGGYALAAAQMKAQQGQG